ncbi:hypothetical protein BS47DRAFT_1355607 [Hydnum rufescens UP504]|uniref:Uncharacterized protein n=1 Tax=Hydnum rufescens UP504 TaxID=1448309 RepID=A0A9P6DME5_9AGAM|nr:hypothetical protein BS47DRAFT_1355607 [Hydnum rufescens UP504]
MPPRLFNVARTALFIASLVFAIVVLGVAAWLETILEPSTLTRFVPIAIFVSVFTVTFATIILFFGSREYSHAVTQTRFELVLVFLMGGFWLGLALFLSTQQALVVECSADDDGDGPDYTTEMFHAQYHVLQAFSILETLLLMGYALFLFVLAMRHHASGRKQVWNARVTEAVWFNLPKKSSPTEKEKFTRLPPPILAVARRESNNHLRNLSSPLPWVPQAEINRNKSTRSTGKQQGPPQRQSSRTRGQSVPAVAAYESQTRILPPAPSKRPPTSSRSPIVIPPPLPKNSQSYVAYASNSPANPKALPVLPGRPEVSTPFRPSRQQPPPPQAFRSRTGPSSNQARPAGTADFRPTATPAAFQQSASRPPTTQPRQPLPRNASASRPQTGRETGPWPPRSGGTPYRDRTI